MEQLDIFDLMYDDYKIEKPIRLIELFAGYGSQNLALKYLNANYKHYKICEWATKSIQAYNDLHIQDYTNYSENFSFQEILKYLYDKGISLDYDKPMTLEQIKRKLESWEIVHHINGDKRDNKIENLQLMTQDKHNKLHKEKLPKIKICIECGKEFEPPIKHRNRNVLCSKECWIKHQKKASPFQNIPIISYKNGKKVKEYKSVKEASEDVNGLSTNIVKCLKGKIKSAYGYQWEYSS